MLSTTIKLVILIYVMLNGIILSVVALKEARMYWKLWHKLQP
jgi:hypothetical protein